MHASIWVLIDVLLDLKHRLEWPFGLVLTSERWDRSLSLKVWKECRYFISILLWVFHHDRHVRSSFKQLWFNDPGWILFSFRLHESRNVGVRYQQVLLGVDKHNRPALVFSQSQVGACPFHCTSLSFKILPGPGDKAKGSRQWWSHRGCAAGPHDVSVGKGQHDIRVPGRSRMIVCQVGSAQVLSQIRHWA